MKIYHNPRCSKSRQTLAMIEDNGGNAEIVLYLENPLGRGELAEIIEKLGISPLQLVRKQEADWKANFKGKEMSNDQIIDAMIEFPKLMERPIVVKGKKAVLGRPPENVLELL